MGTRRPPSREEWQAATHETVFSDTAFDSDRLTDATVQTGPGGRYYADVMHADTSRSPGGGSSVYTHNEQYVYGRPNGYRTPARARAVALALQQQHL